MTVPAPCTTALPPASSGAYSTLSDYDAAIELHVDKLDSRTDAQPLTTIIGAPAKTASTMTQLTTSTKLAELEALTAKLVAAIA